LSSFPFGWIAGRFFLAVVTSAARLLFYLSIGLASWIGAAMIERVLDGWLD
jgi:hypothetical protein